MYGIQDKINQILRGAETIKKNSMNSETTNCPNCGAKPMIHSYVCGTTFPNIAGNCSISEICKLTNEVARLRELLERALELYCDCGRYSSNEKTRDKIRKELARLAPTPEETLDGVTMDEWYGGFSKIESTEPANPTCSNTTHKHSYCDCENPTPIPLPTTNCKQISSKLVVLQALKLAEEALAEDEPWITIDKLVSLLKEQVGHPDRQ